MNEEFKKLLEDKEFLTALVEVKTPESLGKLFTARNIKIDNLTNEEAFRILKEQETAELDERSLEDVSGGIAFTVAAGAVGAFVLGAGAIAFIGGYAYQTIKNGKKK